MARDAAERRVVKCYRPAGRRHLKGAVVHDGRPLSTGTAALSTAPAPRPCLLRVEQLPERVDVATEIVVLGHLPLDLFVAVQEGPVVATPQPFAEPQQPTLGLRP